MTDLPQGESADATTELAALGLREGYLRDVLVAGEEARRTATPNDAPNAAGTLDYLARVRGLRQILIMEEEWRRLNYKQLPLVVNRCRGRGWAAGRGGGSSRGRRGGGRRPQCPLGG